MRALLSRVTALTTLGRIYTTAAGDRAGAPFATRALAALDISVAAEGSGRIPASGPLVVVANHPFGALDGLVLLDLLARVRPDTRLLGNRWLAALPELRPQLLQVDVFGGRAAVHRNGVALREALQWLAQGGCVALFPAGEVAHAAVDGRVVDSPWRATAGELAVRAGAAVLPVFFAGANSRLFRAAGRIHPFLRTALLPHELNAKRGSRISVRVGEPVAATELAAVGDSRARIAHLRSAVDALAEPAPKARVPVAPRGEVNDLLADIAALGAPLLESGAYQVFCATASQLPAVLPEIGRLREISFRAVSEGTGRERDLDRFDPSYRHLFVWNRERAEVAGAYRLGATDEIGAAAGLDGLYTRTLFDYGDELIGQLGPALELGRSFVAPAYQRDFSPLLLLWKGISRFVVRNPRYRRLFGVVSISDAYESTSRQLMIKFLQTTRFDADLGRLVRARNPPAPPRDGLVESATVERLEDVSALIRGLEPDGKDMPVLLRQYLKLNARLLGFSIDPAFGNALDGLVVVDLDDVEPAILARFMGRDEAVAFRVTAV
ncbi:MAG TPA: GNAT family N-acyltransferase [Vicinamibacterales bacterium]|jgi:putative hemolysin|nr:GNAT family N-acyltransferase [Vicinamibacterales bacterium]